MNLIAIIIVILIFLFTIEIKVASNMKKGNIYFAIIFAALALSFVLLFNVCSANAKTPIKYSQISVTENGYKMDKVILIRVTEADKDVNNSYYVLDTRFGLCFYVVNSPQAISAVSVGCGKFRDFVDEWK